MTGRASDSQFQILISENPEALEIYKRELEAEIARRTADLSDESFTAKKHDLMLLACATAFMPDEHVSHMTGYSLFSSEPLIELTLDASTEDPPKCFDVLLVNKRCRSVIAVECRTAHNTTRINSYEGDVRDVWLKLESLLKRREYLGEILGFGIDRVEAVMCVEIRQVMQAAHSLYRVEAGPDSRTSAPEYRIKLWSWNQYQDGLVQLASAIQRSDGFWNRHESDELTKTLTTGAGPGARQAFSPCFVNSPSWQQARALGVFLGEELRQEEGSTDGDGPVGSRFSRARVIAFFAESLMHYAADVLGPRIADSILEKLLTFGLVRQVSGSDYDLNISARSPDTLGARFEEELRAGIAREKAEKRAVQAVLARFAKQRPMLFSDL